MLLKEAILVDVSLAHDEKRHIAGHLGECLRERCLVDLTKLDDLAQLRHHKRLNVAHVKATLLISVHASEELLRGNTLGSSTGSHAFIS